MVFMIIIMVGGLNYYVQPQITIVRQKIKRLAISSAQSSMEIVRALDFTAITPDSNETDTPVALGSIIGLRTATVTTVDDAADGLGSADADADADADTVDYKTIAATISWTSGGQRQISFSTKVSAYGN